MTDASKGSGGTAAFVWIGAVALGLLHQDFWFWDDKTLVFGFMPIGLFYHACFSLAAGVLWACAVKFAWPHRIEAWADEFDAEHAAEPETAPGPGGQHLHGSHDTDTEGGDA